MSYVSFAPPAFGAAAPLDIAVGITQVFFMSAELYLSYFVITSFIRVQTLDFYRYIDSEITRSAAAAEAQNNTQHHSTMLRRGGGSSPPSSPTLSPSPSLNRGGSGAPNLRSLVTEGFSGLRSFAFGAEPDSASAARRLAGLPSQRKND